MNRNRIYTFTFFITFILFSMFGCQEQAKTDAQTKSLTSQPSPRITFEKMEYNFGEVSTSKKHTGQFKFTNTGEDLLKITEVKRCCGVVAELDNNKREYLPGETGVLNVTYTSSSSAGTMRRQLHIVSNDLENPETTLTIKATIVPKIAYEPERLEIRLKGENAGCPPITIRSLDKKPFSIKAFKSTRDCLTVEFDPNEEATQFVLHPEFHSDKLEDRSAGVISIELTHPDCKKLSMSFRPIPEFTTEPRLFLVMKAEPQKPTVRKIDVLNNYDEDFEVESITSKIGSQPKILNQQKITGGYRFEIEITPPAPDEKGRYDDTLNVNIKGGKKLEINTFIRYSIQSDSAQLQTKLDN